METPENTATLRHTACGAFLCTLSLGLTSVRVGRGFAHVCAPRAQNRAWDKAGARDLCAEWMGSPLTPHPHVHPSTIPEHHQLPEHVGTHKPGGGRLFKRGTLFTPPSGVPALASAPVHTAQQRCSQRGTKTTRHEKHIENIDALPFFSLFFFLVQNDTNNNTK